jgi:hypothetical protein
MCDGSRWIIIGAETNSMEGDQIVTIVEDAE